VRRHASWDAFVRDAQPAADRLFAFTTRGSRPFAEVSWQAGDWLVFGSETAGLPGAVRDAFDPGASVCAWPMRAGQRSLNLSNAGRGSRCSRPGASAVYAGGA